MSVWVLLLFFKSALTMEDRIQLHELGVYTSEERCNNDMAKIWKKQKEESEYLSKHGSGPIEYLIPKCIKTERIK